MTSNWQVSMVERRLIEVEGVVQGVGFRPFVHRLAAAGQLCGSVRNGSAGVVIDIEGEAANVDAFCRSLAVDLPALAVVERIGVAPATPAAYREFRILESEPAVAESVTRVPADVATCADCLTELFDPENRRFGHPFITCTDCGPRFTIVRDTPFDRERTTMAGFEMCAACRREYADPLDRRFHAETIACPACGPTLRVERAVDGPTYAAVAGGVTLDVAVETIEAGGIVAIKALGGFHLSCDAMNEEAVARLRKRKRRAAKPFAIMVRDARSAARLCVLSADEQRLLQSSARPIVLLRRRESAVAASVAPSQPTLGVMLPSTPLHHLLLARLDRALVMTSGNRSDEPVVIDDAQVRETLGDVADLWLTHDRAIAARCDDSVVRVTGGHERVIRRARGYVPGTIPIAAAPRGGVLALGGHLKNTVCVIADGTAILSPHVGDLESVDARTAFRTAVTQVLRAAGTGSSTIAHDLHPDYASTRMAGAVASDLGIERRVAVQHHHAHVAACVAEHGVRGPVIGVAFDGAGLGTDGAIWGGEFLLADGARFTRFGHLAYVPLPGGDAAARRPWRSAAAHVSQAGLASDMSSKPPVVDESEWSLVQQLLARDGAGLARTSSVGRLFDAVASLLGLCHVARFEGEAAMALEAAANPRARPRYTAELSAGAAWTGNPTSIIRGILDDRDAGLDVPTIAGAFHHALSDLVVQGCERVRESSGVSVVALSGGVFMNALLLELATVALAKARFSVHVPRMVPCNDGGLSLGQAYVAACALEEDTCA